ncbi:MAG: hypothetical protein Q4C42_11020 [Clostridia bacterium]|nr:hypothetical protein [Clostridia bacterium]
MKTIKLITKNTKTNFEVSFENEALTTAENNTTNMYAKLCGGAMR